MATTYLSYTQGTPTDNLKWTWSSWIKRGAVNSSAVEYLFTTYVDASNYFNLRFNDTDFLDIYNYSSGGAAGRIITNRAFRDPSAWYHIVFVYDSANGVAGDRMRLYVNGVEETSFTVDASDPSSSQVCIMNANTRVAEIGRRSDASTNFTGVMAHTHFCDGQAYAASDFGETDSTSGIWVPKTGPSVTYGDNGFFLKYASGALGTDSSGEGNTMTVSGTMTPTKDNAQNNFCTLNPIAGDINEIALSNGNLTTVASASGNGLGGTLGVASGKWYWEAELNGATSGEQIGILDASKIGCNQDITPGETPNNGFVYTTAGYVYNNGSALLSGLVTATTGDIISMALDITNLKIYWYKNNVLINTGGTSITADLTWIPVGGTGGGSERMDQDYNFGNGYFGTTSHGETNADDAGIGLFKYDVPAGYYALCTNNLGDQS
jgi:hypothetical protein